MSMMIDGSRSFDRNCWLEEAFRFGQDRFRHSTNTFEHQQLHLLSLVGAGQGLCIDGIQPPVLSPFVLLNARAHLRSGTSSGCDGIPPEVYKELPFLLLIDF